MTPWFSKLFSRVDGSAASGPGVDDSQSAAGEKRTGAGKPRAAAHGDAERTERIDRAKTARLAWPARDENKPEAAGERAPPIRQAGSPLDPHEAPTQLVGNAGGRTRRDDADASARMPTQERRPVVPRPVEPAPEQSDDTTRLVAPHETEHNDPVVGWLVVVQGPGRGRSLEIGAGANPIGRAQHQKICLDFGDFAHIARTTCRCCLRSAVAAFFPAERRSAQFDLCGG